MAAVSSKRRGFRRGHLSGCVHGSIRGLIYVLHAFQKKSKKGIAMPKQTIEVIKQRLRDAEEDYRAHKEGERKP